MKNLLTQLPLNTLIEVHGNKYEKLIEVRANRNHYARLVLENPGTAYLTWIEGEGSGNILMCGVLQQLIILNCDYLMTQVSPRDGMDMNRLQRFYQQFGLQQDRGLSKKYGRTIFGGTPFVENTLTNFVDRIKSIV